MFAKQGNGIQHGAGVTKAGSSVTIQTQLDPPLACGWVELGRVGSSRVESSLSSILKHKMSVRRVSVVQDGGQEGEIRHSDTRCDSSRKVLEGPHVGEEPHVSRASIKVCELCACSNTQTLQYSQEEAPSLRSFAGQRHLAYEAHVCVQPLNGAQTEARPFDADSWTEEEKD